MTKNKRGMSAWIWILITLILIAIGIGIYFLLSGDGVSIINSGNSISQPPDLPSG